MPSADNPLEHCVSSMGKTRDLDGSVDRVPDPPEKIWQLLYVLQRKCEDENINIEAIFEVHAHFQRHESFRPQGG